MSPAARWRETTIAGVDEVGRGSLFGPVFAGAVILPKQGETVLGAAGLTDSKALSPRRRAELVPMIRRLAAAWAIGQASAAEIDRLGIRRATELAMQRALQRLNHPFKLVVVDGVLPLRSWQGPQQTLVGGDRLCAAISAASVLAKEERDALIRRLALRFPGYGLERHAGYGTAQHRLALQERGPTLLHRRTFLRHTLQGKSDHPGEISASDERQAISLPLHHC
ncbi:MAG: ribonuclease HII [Cyanobacteriota bacterium]|nr:ribonuclease HII [Cyanobacteriota bacterium]